MARSPTVLVHGDLWHGNVMWVGDGVSAIIDWGAAGPAEVLAAWESGYGRAADDVAY